MAPQVELVAFFSEPPDLGEHTHLLVMDGLELSTKAKYKGKRSSSPTVALNSTSRWGPFLFPSDVLKRNTLSSSTHYMAPPSVLVRSETFF